MIPDSQENYRDEKTSQSERESKDFNNEKFTFVNFWVDLVSWGLIVAITGGSYYLYLTKDETLEEPKRQNPSFKFPEYSDLKPSLYYFILMVLLHEIMRRLVAPKMANYLSPRYFKENDADLIEIYKNKVATNLYKFGFYLSTTVFGFYVLKDYYFFPSSLLGNGELKNLLEKGYPDYLYFEQSDSLILYYNYNLAFAIFDGWYLLTSPLQSDFLFMLLHHFATYSLIIFSYVGSYSSIGSIIYFLHFFGDVFTYFTRVIVHLNIPDPLAVFSSFILLFVFVYTRLYVFGDILYQIYYGLQFTPVITYLFSFALILMILNILWIVLISKKAIKYLITGSIEEIYKFKSNKNKSH